MSKPKNRPRNYWLATALFLGSVGGGLILAIFLVLYIFAALSPTFINGLGWLPVIVPMFVLAPLLLLAFIVSFALSGKRRRETMLLVLVAFITGLPIVIFATVVAAKLRYGLFP
jgi:hypothetical protein